MLTSEPRSKKVMDDFKTLKVKHPRLEEAEQFLKQSIFGYRTHTLLDLYGTSGVGKSTVMEQVAQLVREAETNPAAVPVLIVQASPEDVGRSSRLDYYYQILSQVEHHPAMKDRVKNLPLFLNPGKKSVDPAEWLEMRNAVEYAFSLLQVKVVFVDEAQHLLASDPLIRPTAQLDWLKTLANRTNVLHVLVGNFDLYECCHLNGQAVRRMRDYPFHRYRLDNQKECEEFVGALKSFLLHIPLTVEVPDLLARWQWFGELSVGCVGILGDWIVETVDALWNAGETALTVDALTKYALQPDQRARLEIEARTGENRVARAEAQREQALQKSLGASKAMGAAQPVPALPQDPSGGKTAGKGRKIERATQRDPVGDQVLLTTPGKCTFSGILDIPIQQFLDSGTDQVECPNCHALRGLTPRKNILRYPSHDQRKTQTPQTVLRWAQGETGWDPVSGVKK